MRAPNILVLRMGALIILRLFDTATSLLIRNIPPELLELGFLIEQEVPRQVSGSVESKVNILEWP